MARFIVLDSSPLGLACNRPGTPQVDRCRAWIDALEAAGAVVVIPEVADYEVRRKLLHIGAARSLQRLDDLAADHVYAAITTAVMRRAAELWADARRRGLPTAAPMALDADAILAAQAILLAGPGDAVTVATDNVGHLGQFVDARLWPTIT